MAEFSEAGARLKEKVIGRTGRLGVIGLGYVGLPLALEMADNGFDVTGIDTDNGKVVAINAGRSHVLDISGADVRKFVDGGTFRATRSFDVLEQLDAISICVPTPLRKSRDPDLSYIIAAVEAVAEHLKRGQLIILESTTYPGTTKEVVLPILEKSGLHVGEDFFLAFSPERVDPGNIRYMTKTIPKVVGGVTGHCTDLGVLLYNQFIDNLVPVSSPETAEMVKLMENTFRSVNIALANEMAQLCHAFGIDVWDVIDAAKTKPFGFMPFYPGPGLGGHCIPVDPYYLTWKARLNGIEPRLIEIAGQINSGMPDFTVSRIADALNEKSKSLRSSRLLALGVAYKKDVNDIRESPAIEVLKRLHAKGVVLSYSDPYVPQLRLEGLNLDSIELDEGTLRSVDCVVMLTDHTVFDAEFIARYSPLLVDCRNAFRKFSDTNIVKL